MEKDFGEIPSRKDGGREGRWNVIDYTDVIVHIFNDEMRDFYNLERLWENGSNLNKYTDWNLKICIFNGQGRGENRPRPWHFYAQRIALIFSIAKKVGRRSKRHSHLVPHGATVQGGAYALVFEAEFWVERH